MSATILHYIHDPLCGWCYGAAPLVKAAREVLPVRAHGGGMMTGLRRQPVTPQLRDYVMAHDQRIEQMSGQPFGAAYFDGLLRDTSAMFDSEPPTAAVLAADKLAGRGLDMLARLQIAHYVDGRRIAERSVLTEMAGDIGLDPAAFSLELDAVEGGLVQAHIADTRQLMARLGVQGFPSFALERENGLRVIDAGIFIGRPQAFGDWLRAQAPLSATAAAPGFGCGPDSCAI